MLDKYKLSPEIHNAIFEEIKNDCFVNKTSVENPEIFILGGQTAAGKSVLTHKICETFNNPNIVVINSDEFRLNHPQAQEIFQKHNKDFATYTDYDMRKWGKGVFDEAISRHYNIIFEGTMRTPQICETIKRLQKEGYKIHILVMAVPEIKSRISIYSRYQEQLEKYPIARFTNTSSHDASYIGMLGTLKIIEDEKLYDTIEAYNREGKAIFKTGDTDIVKAIITEREKPLSAKDCNALINECDILLNKMYNRNEDEYYIKDLEHLKQIVESQHPNNHFIQSLRKMHESVSNLKNLDSTTKESTSNNTQYTPLQNKNIFEK